jgi:hypothetical protein
MITYGCRANTWLSDSDCARGKNSGGRCVLGNCDGVSLHCDGDGLCCPSLFSDSDVLCDYLRNWGNCDSRRIAGTKNSLGDEGELYPYRLSVMIEAQNEVYVRLALVLVGLAITDHLCLSDSDNFLIALGMDYDGFFIALGMDSDNFLIGLGMDSDGFLSALGMDSDSFLIALSMWVVVPVVSADVNCQDLHHISLILLLIILRCLVLVHRPPIFTLVLILVIVLGIPDSFISTTARIETCHHCCGRACWSLGDDDGCSVVTWFAGIYG